MIEGEKKGNRSIWLIVGGIGTLVIFSFCALFVVAGLFLVSSPNSSIQSSEAAPLRAPLVQQVATPPSPVQPVVIGQDATDYETAVLIAIYEKVGPSVVNVDVLSFQRNMPQQLFPEPGQIDPETLIPQGQGSGFVWDTDGHIVTNAHVVDTADQVQITFPDGTVTLAEVIGMDRHSDLAVLEIDPVGYNLIPVARGDLDQMKVGMRVAAIGNPFGFEGTLTSGIVSAIGRSIPGLASFSIPESIQTDAAINPGNSGGPLLNERGEVIGVNAQIRTAQGSNSGVGFAIPITIVDRVVPVLIAEGKYEHSYIGISGNTFSPICAEGLGLDPQIRGAYVNTVLPGTPAAKGGLRGGREEIQNGSIGICPTVAGGDLITAIEDQPVARFDDLLVFLERYTSPGDTVTLTVLRDGKTIEVSVTLAPRPAAQP
ncbi:MAG: trypsin-like peptidase domain-containing protein [Caldilineaceae bacterium]|nr:trypsin-like peptidase domain-containing protein [Caldilineaceae bacterium]